MEIIRKSREDLNNKDLYFMLTDKSIKKMTEAAGKKIKVIDWVIYQDARRDTGEVQEICSIRTTDTAYATNSKSFIESFNAIVSCFGSDFSEIEVLENKSPKGRVYLTCTYVG